MYTALEAQVYSQQEYILDTHVHLSIYTYGAPFWGQTVLQQVGVVFLKRTPKQIPVPPEWSLQT